MEDFAEASGSRAAPVRASTWLVGIGWVLYAVSLALPANSSFGVERGLEALVLALIDFDTTGPGSVASALTNVLLPIATFAKRVRWALPALAGATAFNALYWTGWAMAKNGSVDDLLIGYWCWIASFACVALGVKLRNRAGSS